MDILGYLEKILCILENLPWWILWVLVKFVNLMIAALAVVIYGLLAVMPSIPDAPDNPYGAGGEKALHYASWFWPVAYTISLFGVMAVLYLGFLGMRVLLRWLKVLS